MIAGQIYPTMTHIKNIPSPRRKKPDKVVLGGNSRFGIIKKGPLLAGAAPDQVRSLQ